LTLLLRPVCRYRNTLARFEVDVQSGILVVTNGGEVRAVPEAITAHPHFVEFFGDVVRSRSPVAPVLLLVWAVGEFQTGR